MSSSKKLNEKPVYLSSVDVNKIIDMLPEAVIILSDKSEVITANRFLLDYLEYESLEQIINLKFGQLFSCIHTCHNSHTCGTTEFCTKCGANHSIKAALELFENEQECRITSAKIGNYMVSYDFKVYSKPVMMNDRKAIFLFLKDISSEKRKIALERIFFHDIINTASGLKGFLEIAMRSSTLEETREYLRQSSTIYNHMIDEIMSQKQLVAAEDNQLIVSKSMINSLKLISDVIKPHMASKSGLRRKISINSKAESIDFISDYSLIRRVLENIIKNAIEATDIGAKIEINVSKSEDNKIKFSVFNEGYIPKDIQLQIFKRSFSTKGADRGLGTYSIKLLTEKYLKGLVSFITSQNAGTTFFVEYPIVPE